MQSGSGRHPRRLVSEMVERTPLPVDDEGIDVDAILRGLRPRAHEYSVDVEGEPATVRVSRWSVDDDGTFVPPTGNVMIRFDVAGAGLMPGRAVSAIRWIAPVNLAALYLYSHAAGSVGTRFEVAAFFSVSGTQIDAPSDFDWQKYAIRHSGSYTVYRTTVASEQPVGVYRSPGSTCPTWTGVERTGMFGSYHRLRSRDLAQRSRRPGERCRGRRPSEATSGHSRSSGCATARSRSPSS